MLLDHAYKLTQKGEEMPLSFWLDEYKKIAPDLKSNLEKVSGKLQDNTKAKNDIRIIIIKERDGSLTIYPKTISSNAIAE